MVLIAEWSLDHLVTPSDIINVVVNCYQYGDFAFSLKGEKNEEKVAINRFQMAKHGQASR
jgi:hypothetical protein